MGSRGRSHAVRSPSATGARPWIVGGSSAQGGPRPSPGGDGFRLLGCSVSTAACRRVPASRGDAGYGIEARSGRPGPSECVRSRARARTSRAAGGIPCLVGRILPRRTESGMDESPSHRAPPRAAAGTRSVQDRSRDHRARVGRTGALHGTRSCPDPSQHRVSAKHPAGFAQRRDVGGAIVGMATRPMAGDDHGVWMKGRGEGAVNEERSQPRLGTDRNHFVQVRELVQPRSSRWSIRLFSVATRTLGERVRAVGRTQGLPLLGTIRIRLIRGPGPETVEDLERGKGIAKDVQFQPRHRQKGDDELETSHWIARCAPHDPDPG